MMIFNLTPHVVRVELESGESRSFEPAGLVPRVSMIEEPAAEVAGIPTVTTRAGSVQDLPARAPAGKFYIVSGLVAAAAPERDDLLVPHGLVRDSAGRVTGCRGFRRNQ